MEKYAVLKIEDWQQIKEMISPLWGYSDLPGCTVIRHQDIFAAPALAEYAGQISTTIEVMASMDGAKESIFSSLPITEMYKQLGAVRDYFYEQAEIARRWPLKKLPD